MSVLRLYHGSFAVVGILAGFWGKSWLSLWLHGDADMHSQQTLK